MELNGAPEPAPKPSSKKKDPKPAEEPVPTGHSLILQKLRRSLAIAHSKPVSTPEPESTPAADEPEIEIETVEATGLEPLPQPEPTKASKPVSTLFSLPSWLKEPISVSPTTRTPFSSITGLSPKLQQRLGVLSLTEAFAVQTSVLPLLLDAKTGGDLCISAATGSGKTLAYVLPIIQSLSSRVVTRLRAIVVVPTRELVQQVNSTAVSISSGTGLKIGTAIGSRSLAVEQGLLVAEEDDGSVVSKVDILITTPGRLVEHVRATPGFDLTWVKWLVIDEADRLLAQSFQEWVNVVIVGLEEAAAKHCVDSIAGVDLGNLGLRSGRREAEKVRKVVLSATMTRDVGKLAGLRLRRPRLVVVEDPPLPEDINMADAGEDDAQEGEELEQFSVPAGLREHVIPVESSEHKPLYLLYLLRKQGIKTGALVFVKSNEGAARLAKLLETVGEKSGDKLSVGLVTGEMEKKRREKILKRFSKSEVDILVCSDLISRGLDLPNIRHIINYDIPASTRAYVHRVGRTARAGNEGDAWTLLGNNEARWFWRNIGKAIRRAIAVKKVPIVVESEGVGLRKAYEEVLYGEE
ncbi:ATP-dependent RNA helicase dbp6 [Tricharina praecox]|uniref:ATP-dependent RNA helicase dbp6 n=1 Tax=Tricharina praecox TaxID=43433 RepID=UPI00221F5169|nr:ATP-dependent RNA helicase dbp6 [Tricharina praecox]KAI5844780.1 ATP-dependent RNA helicase dbp6 [Tricharina praecox]